MKPRPVELSPVELRFDLGAWLEDEAVLVERSGPEWVISCPYCGREKLAVHVTRKAWHCWICGRGGWTPTSLVAALLGVPTEEAEAIVAAKAGGRTLGPVRSLGEEEGAPLDPDFPEAPQPPGLYPLHDPEAGYLAGRGVSRAHADAFGVMSCRGDGSSSIASRVLCDRAMFLVWRRGRVVFWTGRSVHAGEDMKLANLPRPCREITHAPGCTCNHERWGLRPTPGVAGKEAVVLGLHLVRPGERVIVVEGPIDAAVVGPGAVATLGANMSVAQAREIAATGAAEAVVVYDGDEAGYRGLWGRRTVDGPRPGAAQILAGALPTRAALCPSDTDPGTLGRDAVLRIADAAPWVEYREVAPLGRVARRTTEVPQGRPFVASLGSGKRA